MAVGDVYASQAELSSRLGNGSNLDSDELDDALAAASREVDGWCERSFWDAASPSARVYQATGPARLEVHDFSTATGLVVKTDSGDDGLFATSLSSDEFEVGPANQVVNGQTGWPFWWVSTLGGASFPLGGRRTNRVQVTARWGWAAIPEPVKRATLILAAESYKMREAPLGVAGFGEFGVVRVRDIPKVGQLLRPFRRYPAFVL